jgi:glutaminase
VFSPRLDAKGNSLRGLKVCEALSRDFGLHLFNAATASKNLKDWIEGGELVDDW